ncbi:MAG TPA: pyrroline-5-carboxylate reductase [Leptospiraceae bacterium]|nr:pyrroline-5-carboxylate reductase [Leptospiraceae bacterium]HMW07375.1 pyrroline-5-carboxylate reductase [Leptospiraceae bacterium]HMY32439.1 pyrroline-5-carboxylate reductase [Leptospiraceae bacterium]HMZ64194.1 pyrroline-5-carboxylate reductase [Leptospiraceae bacterium]HNA08446.1 pyrroline-5-carboxylate reductase [Leptospiraceae bacterium]
MKKVGIIGLGNMGYPIYKAIESDFSVLCYDPYSKRNDIKFESDFSSLNDSCDRLILCVKPDKIVDTLKQIKEPKKIFSIAAGINLDTLKKHAPSNSYVVRIMPNLPLKIQEGCMGYIGDKEAYPDIKEIFNKLGLLVELSSELAIDAVTGLSGSGPAFVFSFIQALAEGGVKSGLTYADALRLSIQTVKGSAMLLEKELEKENTHPSVLRNRVTSPGGTTIFGLEKLEENGMHYSVMNAVYSAFKRAQELSQPHQNLK